jgi:hypothetical protein
MTVQKPRRNGSRRRSKRRHWPLPRRAAKEWRRFRRLPPAAQAVLGAALALLLWFASNGIYQVVRKPSELFFPVSGALNRTPIETWERYAPLFERHSTAVITPGFLAAIAQIEGSGNPVVRTYWRWSWTPHPFQVYRPASSAVGMYQITDGNFALARHYCIHDHVVVEDGPWNHWRSCWFNSLYTRVIPSHAVELTAAYLDRSVAAILARHRIGAASLRQKQELAALIHLCGAGAGDGFARRRFQLAPGQRCGDHEARLYLARMRSMRMLFEGLARKG